MRNGVESRNGSWNGTLYVNYLLVQPIMITTWMSRQINQLQYRVVLLSQTSALRIFSPHDIDFAY